MERHVVHCDPDELVVEVARKMRKWNIGMVPVCDPDGRVLGTITDRDLAVRVVAEARAVEQTRARDVMSGDVVTCDANAELEVAEQKMSQRRVSRILCTDESGRLAGVISLVDIALIDEGGRAVRLLRALAERDACFVLW